MDKNDKIRDFIFKNKILIFFISIAIFIILIFIVIYFATNKFYSPNGGDIKTEYDPISGQTIETINQEVENNGEPIKTPTLIGFDTYMKFGYTYDQYDILINELYNYFKNNKPNINRISYIVDSIEYDEEEVSILYSTIVDNENNKYTLITNTHNTFKKLQIIILNSDKQELYNSSK